MEIYTIEALLLVFLILITCAVISARIFLVLRLSTVRSASVLCCCI